MLPPSSRHALDGQRGKRVAAMASLNEVKPGLDAPPPLEANMMRVYVEELLDDRDLSSRLEALLGRSRSAQV
jgi:hypothetical protein